MLKNLALLVSLCANAGLSASLLLGAKPTTAAAPFPAVDVRAAPPQPRSAADAAAYYRDLKARGLDEHEAKLLLGARLEERAMAKLSAPPDR
ncbi:MAG TPA: hypothetical protein VFO94_01460, partial [Gammaproteobacteria bacterium]|nr:hypothetical protein [Gammaproteobacteria bacterium]